MLPWLMTLLLAGALFYKLGASRKRASLSILLGIAVLFLLFWVQAAFNLFAPDSTCTISEKLLMRPANCARGVVAGHGLILYGIAGLIAAGRRHR